MKILLTLALLAALLLAADNYRLRRQINALAADQAQTGLMLTRAEIKLGHMATLVSDLRNGRVD